MDGRSVFLQRALDDLDGTHDAGAKTPRLSQDHFHRFTSIGGSNAKMVKPGSRPKGLGPTGQRSLANYRRASLPSGSKTLATIPLASSPAAAYMAAGLSCSMNLSGSTMQRTLSPWSKAPCWVSACRTWALKPP